MYNILICDDERDIVAALKIYLAAEDYNIYEAYSLCAEKRDCVCDSYDNLVEYMRCGIE